VCLGRVTHIHSWVRKEQHIRHCKLELHIRSLAHKTIRIRIRHRIGTCRELGPSCLADDHRSIGFGHSRCCSHSHCRNHHSCFRKLEQRCNRHMLEQQRRRNRNPKQLHRNHHNRCYHSHMHLLLHHRNQLLHRRNR
jgi:hypothetical protein